MTKIKVFIIIPTVMMLFLSSCRFGMIRHTTYHKYSEQFIGVFDTYMELLCYAKTEEEFNLYADIIYEKIKELNDKYDIYNEYDGINNIYTVNKNAGITPVKVDRDVIDLLVFGKEAYEKTNGVVNIAMGPVLSIWHEYRENGIRNEKQAKLPPIEDLRAAASNTDINNIIIDKENSTVFLKNKGMSLDVGAIAKGFAAQRAVNAAKVAGMTSALFNAGGNVIAVGEPLDADGCFFRVGVQNPEKSAADIFDVVYLTDKSVVSSGSYQRYYIVDGNSYHHIIDPGTLYPAEQYEAVTILHDDSGLADVLSTAAFILPVEEAEKILKLNNAEAVWIMKDGSFYATEGYKKVSKNLS